MCSILYTITLCVVHHDSSNNKHIIDEMLEKNKNDNKCHCGIENIGYRYYVSMYI